MTSIEAGPHYEIPSAELASWLEKNAPDSWWYVDGDPLLTGRMPFPCPTDELATELRKLARPLLIQAPKGDREAKGQQIDASKVGALASRFRETVDSEPLPAWANDRFFFLCWKGSSVEWLLGEDSATAAQFRADAAAQAK